MEDDLLNSLQEREDLRLAAPSEVSSMDSMPFSLAADPMVSWSVSSPVLSLPSSTIRSSKVSARSPRDRLPSSLRSPPFTTKADLSSFPFEDFLVQDSDLPRLPHDEEHHEECLLVQSPCNLLASHFTRYLSSPGNEQEMPLESADQSSLFGGGIAGCICGDDSEDAVVMCHGPSHDINGRWFHSRCIGAEGSQLKKCKYDVLDSSRVLLTY